ncbi:HD domain-containing protein [Luedemannella flava]
MTSRRPAAACATSASCAASGTPRSPTRGGRPSGPRTPVCSTCATRCTSSPAGAVTASSPRTSPRSAACSSSSAGATPYAAGSPTTPARSRTPSTTPCAPPNAGWPCSVAVREGQPRPYGCPWRPTWSPRTARSCSPAPPSPRRSTRPCRCAWPPRPPATGCASRPARSNGSPGAARPAPTVAGVRPRRVRPASRLRPGAGRDLGGVRPVRPGQHLAAGVGPDPQRPQHNPVHRYTLDRHLIETVGHAARFAREVARPDLLSLGALLHDIGKGLPGDHSVVGVDVAVRLATSIGISREDASVIGTLVRHHLLLPEVATRRDLADPETVRHVVDCVGDVDTLELLHALSRADAAATGPAAWSAWKERLVADLVHRVRTALESGIVAAPPSLDTRYAVLATGALPAVELTPDRVVVAAYDRPGLLASVAGCLTLHRLDVVSVDASTVPVDGGLGREVAIVVCRVQPRDAAGPDRERLVGDVRRAVSGELRVDEALAARARASRLRSTNRGVAPPPPRVVWAVDGATDAAILELRAGDDVGLLFRVARALEETGADIRAARISTLGADIVDAFYLNGDWSDPEARARIERALLAAAAPADAPRPAGRPSDVHPSARRPHPAICSPLVHMSRSRERRVRRMGTSGRGEVGRGRNM